MKFWLCRFPYCPSFSFTKGFAHFLSNLHWLRIKNWLPKQFKGNSHPVAFTSGQLVTLENKLVMFYSSLLLLSNSSFYQSNAVSFGDALCSLCLPRPLFFYRANTLYSLFKYPALLANCKFLYAGVCCTSRHKKITRSKVEVGKSLLENFIY